MLDGVGVFSPGTQHCFPGCQFQLLPHEGVVVGVSGLLGLQQDLLESQLQLLGQEYPEGGVSIPTPMERQMFKGDHQKPEPHEVLEGVLLDLQHQETELQVEPLGQVEGICLLVSLDLGTQHFSLVCQ